MKKAQKNTDIRELIRQKGLKHYEVAELLNIGTYTFSHWLQRELSPEKKEEIINAIKQA